MSRACRTCTQPITSNDYFLISGSSHISSGLLIRHLLQSCIPECDLDLTPNSAICRNCTSALHIAYCFKRETIKNEEAFRKRQHVRIKNIDALTKATLGELETAFDDECEQNEEAFEVELADVSDLKVEFVYDGDEDANDVEIVADNEPVIEDQQIKDEGAIKDVEFQFLENLVSDVGLQDSLQISNDADGNFEETEDNSEADGHLLDGLDPSEVSELTEIDKPTPNLENVMSFIQRTSCSSRKMRDVKRPYKCNECNFRSDGPASLRMHKRIHTGEKPFHCTKCAYKAKRKAHLDDHMKIHTGERPYPCPSCDKSFISKQIMKKHQRIHTGEKPYECRQCNFQSRHKVSIENHVKKVHIGITKFSEHQPSVCYICGKCLSGAAALSTHMRIHTGVKSHLCELCGRYFREKGMLKNHLRTHTGEKPFKCSECDYIATRKAHLQDHMRTHIGRLELVECNECGKRYATKLLLKKHIKEQHKIEIVPKVQFTAMF